MLSAGELVARSAAELAGGPHPERARLDAETLLLHVLARNKAWLLAHAGDAVPVEAAKRYTELLERRLQGEPIQYIRGEAEFYGLPLRVTPAVLIPRPETEHLVERALEFARDLASPQMVDVGTGSGAIAIALARHLPHAQMTAIDLSSAALVIARQNAARNAATIRFVQGDLLAPVAGQRFDVIVSNPPYVPEGDRAGLATEVRDYEPALALFAGRDGLEMYGRLIPQAAGMLTPGGLLALEVGCGQAHDVLELLRAARFRCIETVADLQGIPRVVSGLND